MCDSIHAMKWRRKEKRTSGAAVENAEWEGQWKSWKLVLVVSFSELSLSDASSSSDILAAAPCLVTALLGPPNNILLYFCCNVSLPPLGVLIQLDFASLHLHSFQFTDTCFIYKILLYHNVIFNYKASKKVNDIL